MRLILFDIDGTLLKTGGAGGTAMHLAFEELYGVPNAFEDVSMGGRLDPAILAEAMSIHQIDGDGAAFLPLYVKLLKEELPKPRDRQTLLPGVIPLLMKLEAEDHTASAILTGNFRAGAIAKLDYFELSDFFEVGAYGEDAPTRAELLPVAAERAMAFYGFSVEPKDIVVVGDTARDIQCAKANGAVSVAVATGWTDYEELLADEPDHCLHDLTDLDAVMTIMKGSF